MPTIVQVFAIDIAVQLFAFSIVFLFARRIKKNVIWAAPVIMVTGGLLYLIDQISRYGHEASFREDLRIFFHNDSSMIVYLFLAPMLVITLVFWCAGYFVLKNYLAQDRTSK